MWENGNVCRPDHGAADSTENNWGRVGLVSTPIDRGHQRPRRQTSSLSSPLRSPLVKTAPSYSDGTIVLGAPNERSGKNEEITLIECTWRRDGVDITLRYRVAHLALTSKRFVVRTKDISTQRNQIFYDVSAKSAKRNAGDGPCCNLASERSRARRTVRVAHITR